MTTENMTFDADGADTDFLGDACLSVGDVVCLKSGGFGMTVETLIADDEDDEFTEGYAVCVWAKEDETIARDTFRTETLDNMTAEDEFDDLDLSDEILEMLAKRADDGTTH